MDIKDLNKIVDIKTILIRKRNEIDSDITNLIISKNDITREINRLSERIEEYQKSLIIKEQKLQEKRDEIAEVKNVLRELG